MVYSYLIWVDTTVSTLHSFRVFLVNFLGEPFLFVQSGWKFVTGQSKICPISVNRFYDEQTTFKKSAFWERERDTGNYQTISRFIVWNNSFVEKWYFSYNTVPFNKYKNDVMFKFDYCQIPFQLNLDSKDDILVKSHFPPRPRIAALFISFYIPCRHYSFFFLHPLWIPCNKFALFAQDIWGKLYLSTPYSEQKFVIKQYCFPPG